MVTLTMTKILLVEDDRTMQTVLQTLLELEGYQVVTVPDRKSQSEIIDFIRGEKPDVILLDVHLYESSGIEVLRVLRQDEQFTHTRIVMTSGLDVKDDCLAAGADSFLLKPYMPDELIANLRENTQTG